MEEKLFHEYKTAPLNRKKAIKTVILTANMRFALKSCLLYKTVPGVSIADMMSEAKIGLISAFDSFNPDSGIKFISYAVWQIRHRFSKYFDGIDLIRIPTHRKADLNKMRKTRDVNDFDDEMSYLHNLTQTPISLDMTVFDDADCTLGDTIEDKNIENSESRVYINNALGDLSAILDSTLTSDEMMVLNNLYGLNSYERSGLRGTSDSIGKSHERIRQLKNRALNKLIQNPAINEMKNLVYERMMHAE